MLSATRTFRERILDEEVQVVSAALSDVPFIQSVDFDFVTGKVRITVPRDLRPEESDAIRARARAVTRASVDVRPPVAFPFTMHLRSPAAKVGAAKVAHRVVELDFRAADLDAFRGAYLTLRARAREADFVVAFAPGGLVPLQFVAHLGNAARSLEEQAEIIVAHQQRFHLFPGLLEDGGPGPRLLGTWLETLPPESRVLVLDADGTGHGALRVREALAECVWRSSAIASLSVTLMALFDASRAALPAPASVELTSRGGARVVVTTALVGVNRPLSEDNHVVVGQDFLRLFGAADAPWSSAVVRVADDQGAQVEVAGTRSLPTTVASLLGGNFGRRPLSPEMIEMSLVMGVMGHVNEAARLERNDLGRALGQGLITRADFNEEMRRIADAQQGAQKRYGRL